MPASDNDTASAKKSATPRRVRRRAVVPKFHVDEDIFTTEAEANLWADSLHRAEVRVARTRPDLTEGRAKSLAREIAEALRDLVQDIANDTDGEYRVAEDSEREEHERLDDSAPLGVANGVEHAPGNAH